jgi:hypothetical protein
VKPNWDWAVEVKPISVRLIASVVFEINYKINAEYSVKGYINKIKK